MSDVRVENHGSLFLFLLCTDAAREWVEEHVDAPDYMVSKFSLTVEHRYARDIAEGMMAAGLKVE